VPGREEFLYFICGSTRMNDAVLDSLAELGCAAANRVHVEDFAVYGKEGGRGLVHQEAPTGHHRRHHRVHRRHAAPLRAHPLTGERRPVPRGKRPRGPFPVRNHSADESYMLDTGSHAGFTCASV
jgi:hypothetical protein